MNQDIDLIKENTGENQDEPYDPIWVVGFTYMFLTSLFAFICSGIYIALWLLGWGFGMIFMIMLWVKINRKWDSTEFKYKTIINGKLIEIINRDYTLKQEKDQLIILNEWYYPKKGCIQGLIGTLYISLTLLFLHVIIFIIVIILSVPWVISYYRYRNRVTECVINRRSEKVIFEKLSPTYKVLRQFNFSDVQVFGYALTDSMSDLYSVMFKAISGKRIILFTECKEECISVYKKISTFLESNSNFLMKGGCELS